MKKSTRCRCLLLSLILGLWGYLPNTAQAWFGDWLGYPNSVNMPASGGACGYTYWYAWAHYSSCAGRGFYGHWWTGFVWTRVHVP